MTKKQISFFWVSSRLYRPVPEHNHAFAVCGIRKVSSRDTQTHVSWGTVSIVRCAAVSWFLERIAPTNAKELAVTRRLPPYLSLTLTPDPFPSLLLSESHRVSMETEHLPPNETRRSKLGPLTTHINEHTRVISSHVCAHDRNESQMPHTHTHTHTHHHVSCQL